MPREKKSETLQRGASAIVGYKYFLNELKTQIYSAKLCAVVAVNKEND